MVEDNIAPLAFIAVSCFAFAWVVRLGFQVRRSIRDQGDHLHDRMDELEEAALEIRKDIDEVEAELGSKVDVEHLEKRISGLVELVGGSGKR